ncbi:TPA: DUF1566 domain-containing protein, partial [Vibrio parahaemolyticus]
IFITGGDVEMEPESTHTFHLVGAYDDTEEMVDMNGMTDVDWELLDSAGNPSTLGTIDKATGELTVGTDEGELTVVASYPDAGEASVKVNVVTAVDPMEYVCGHEINNTDPENAKGACLKVATDSAGNWFTSSPSEAMMDALGYKGPDDDPTADTNTNSGKTYANYYTEEGGIYQFGPEGGKFARFRHDGLEGNNEKSQIGRWCQDLAEMSFAGKSDWRMATKNELSGLYDNYSSSDKGLFSARGWPATHTYWSSTPSWNKYYNVSLRSNNANAFAPVVAYYASCVSERP